MKKSLIFILLLSTFVAFYFTIDKLILHKDYRRDSRHFFYTEKGHCITMWRTESGICYIILGKYTSLLRPVSQSYITSPFTKGMTIFWPENTSNVIVDLEDEHKQVIHESAHGVKIINYEINKKCNDSTFFYFDGTYDRYKKDVEFFNINILEGNVAGSNEK